MSISEVLWSWIPTCGWVKTCFFPYRRGVWTSSIAWTHHDRSHESVDPVDAFFLLGSNGVIPMGVPMGVPLYRWMFFLMEHAWKCYKCGDTPQETSICQKAKGDNYMYILYDIYIYIMYLSPTQRLIWIWSLSLGQHDTGTRVYISHIPISPLPWDSVQSGCSFCWLPC